MDLAACYECNIVARALQDQDQYIADPKKFAVWNCDQASKNVDCYGCQELGAAFTYGFPVFEGLLAFSQFRPDLMIHLSFGAEDCSQYLRVVSESPDDCYRSLHFLHVGSEPDPYRAIGVLPEAQIDLQLIRGWLQACEHGHSGVCHPMADPWTLIPPASGLLFIDVFHRFLVEQACTSMDC